MKKFLMIATFLMSCSAMASASYFDRLVQFHERGSRLTFKEFKGFYAGRCFSAYRPYHAVGAMVGYMQWSAKEQVVGPGLSQPVEYKISYIIDGSNAPARFDDNSPANKKQFNEITRDFLRKHSSYVESPTLSYTTDLDTDSEPELRTDLVSYRNYVIQKTSVLVAKEYGKHGFRKPGYIIQMCYFFKKLN